MIDILGVAPELVYVAVVLFMALESSFFPFPSEVVVPPAAYLAAQGSVNILIVIFCGILGSVLGAIFNYWISYRFGRGAVIRFGKKFGFAEKKLQKVEEFFERYGDITTFLGRLLPGIRQYISLPAGLGRMHFGKFILYTAIGSTFWVTVLAIAGYFVGENEAKVKLWISKYYLYFLLVIGLGVFIWFLLKRRLNR